MKCAVVRCGALSGKSTGRQAPPTRATLGGFTRSEKDRSALEEPIQSFKDMGWEGGRLGGEVLGSILGGLGRSWDVSGGLWGRLGRS